MAVLSKIIGRGGLIGKQFIMGTEARREFYAEALSLPNRSAIAERQRLAAEFAAEGSDLVIPKDKGFLVVPPGEIPEAEEVATAAQEALVGVDLEERQRNKKAQLLTGLIDPKDVTVGSPYLRFILREDILKAVSVYLGVVPILTVTDIWYSQPSPSVTDSQLYHCDWADRTQVKVFVYATDVTEATGPLTVLSAADSKRVRDAVGYEFGQYLEDAEVSTALGGKRGDERVVLGDRGTVAFVDTGRCFHYGSRVDGESASRIVGLFQFLTPSAFSLPSSYQKGARLRKLATPGMTRLQRLVLGAER